MDDRDPRRAIFSFLDGLPQTIRTEALLFVIMYAMESVVPEDLGDFAREVKSYLMRPGTPGVSAVICAVAAIDHSFEGVISKLDRDEYLLAALTNRDPTNLGFQHSLLSLPMRRQHWKQAWSMWKSLRTSTLSPTGGAASWPYLDADGRSTLRPLRQHLCQGGNPQRGP